MPEAGYSGRPLLAKLGYRPGQRALLIALPPEPAELAAFPDFAQRETRPTFPPPADAPGPFDLIHAFTSDRTVLTAELASLRARLAPAGMIWISWPKKASKRPTTLTEDVVRALALERGLVDVKVCAVDAVWSGLKLVIPLALRKS